MRKGWIMKRWAIVGDVVCAAGGATQAQEICSWGQWGQSQSHDGEICRPAQHDRRELAHVSFDQFADAEEAEADGELLVHYQAALNDDLDNVYMMEKQGTYQDFYDV